jgi:Cu-processing system ATP-binding protein
MIKVERLEKGFKKNQVLKGIDLELHPGKSYAILGPNGSGKSTLIKSILGLVNPESGNIWIDEELVKNNPKTRVDVGYMPQIAKFPKNLTVSELFGLIEKLRGQKANPDEYIKAFRIEKYLDYKLGQLSGGTIQKVSATIALMFSPRYIVLDEPTVGLDPVSRMFMKQEIKKLKEKQKTIVFTSHLLTDIEDLADEVVFLLEGVVYFKGSPQEILAQTSSANLEEAIAQLFLKEEVYE